MRYLLLLLCIGLLVACDSTVPASPEEIVDKAIAASGGDIISNSSIHFKFRDHYYRAKRQNGLRTFERCTDEACLIQQDILESNGEFKRFRESKQIPLLDSMQQLYSNSVNSVHYFSVLPYGLNDAAVHKSLVDEKTVKGEPYYRIKVSFSEEGGGEDFEDEYLYWIHKKKYTIDYLAYNYKVNEGGTRFREAYNSRMVNGVRFSDYRNYKPDTQFPPLSELDLLFEKEQLQLLSTIELEDPSVRICPDC